MSALLLSTILTLSILVGCSSSNFFLAICMLELSMYTFLFMSYEYKLLSLVAGCIKYFLVQSVGSIFLFLGGVMMYMNFLYLEMNFFLLLGFFLKLGAFPLFFWVMPVNMTLPYTMVGVLSSPMKILPLSLMVQYFSTYLANISNYVNLVVLSGILSIISGMFYGLSSKTLRSMLGASSISHTGWLLVAMPLFCSWHYFLLYSLVVLSFFTSLIFCPPVLSTIGLLGLGGLPPFGVFVAKLWVIMKCITASMPLVFLLAILLSSALSLFYYLKYGFVFFLLSSRGTRLPQIGVFLFLLNLFASCLLLYAFFYSLAEATAF